MVPASRFTASTKIPAGQNNLSKIHSFPLQNKVFPQLILNQNTCNFDRSTGSEAIEKTRMSVPRALPENELKKIKKFSSIEKIFVRC
jgi:hypothetical protein